MAEDISSSTAWAFVDAIKEVVPKDDNKNGATTATVMDIDDDGTVWVLIPGAEDKTPVNGPLLAAVSPGDVVQIEINNGQLSVLGNTTTPAVGQLQVDQSVAPASQMAGQALIIADELQANKADIKELNAAKAHIENLEANKASIADLTATNAQIENLQTSKADVTDLTALNATVTNLDATKANVSDLTATNAHITQLEANKADINLANVNNAWIEHGLVRDAAITDAKIAGVSANKLTAGTIDANDIHVMNLRADNLKVTRINGQPVIGGYVLVDLTDYTGINPSEQGWYELINSAYVLTTDIEVQSNKRYYSAADSVALYDQSTVDSMVNNLNNRIDAQIETWSSDDIPTLMNYPANSWSNSDFSDHIGDICYVNNAGSDSAGFIYRFAYDNSEQIYKWILIRDNNISDALGRISDLETFESNTTTWMNTTDSGLQTIRQNHTALSGKVDYTVKSSTQLWFTKSTNTPPNPPNNISQVVNDSSIQNVWNLAVPVHDDQYPYYFYCWQYLFSNDTYGWSSVILDTATVEVQQKSDDAIDVASAAQTVAENNIKSSVILWYASNTTTPPSKPYQDGSDAHIISTSTDSGIWTTAVPTYSISAPYYHYCYQQQRGDDTWQWTSPVYDAATSVAMQKAQSALPTESFRTFEQTTFKTLVEETDEQRSEIIRIGEITDSLDASELVWEQGGILTDLDNKTYSACKATNNKAIRTASIFSLSSGLHSMHLSATYERVTNPEGNPHDLNWYEISNKKYQLTNDTTVISNKMYYIRNTSWQALLVYFNETGIYIGKTTWLTDGDSHEAPLNTASCAIVVSKISNDDIIPSEIGNTRIHISPYSITLLNTVNRVQQSADSNSAVISSVTTLLGTNSDGTTKDGDIFHKINAAETSITQNANAIALRATKNEVQQSRPAYAFCSTSASTANKIATIDPTVTGYSLYKGAVISVTFNDSNTTTTPTLNVNSTGAKQIRSYVGAALSSAEYKWSAGATIDFVYDGTYWRLQDSGAITRISSAESSIIANANEIELKVSKNGVISSINQSAETIKISAGKVIIGGFNVTNTALYSGTGVTSSAQNAVAITTTEFVRNINSVNRGHLRLAIGSKFAVDRDGNLFATGANLTDLNASKITGGSISANLIKAGVLSDIYGKNTWDLKNGLLTTKGMTAQDAKLTGALSIEADLTKRITLVYQWAKLTKSGGKVTAIKLAGKSEKMLQINQDGILFYAADTRSQLKQSSTRITYGSITTDIASVTAFVNASATKSKKKISKKLDLSCIGIKGILSFKSPAIIMNGRKGFTGTIQLNGIVYKSGKKTYNTNILFDFNNGLLYDAHEEIQSSTSIVKKIVSGNSFDPNGSNSALYI